MKKTFKILVGVLTLVLSVGLLTGCGGKKEDKVIKVGASPAPHGEILEALKDEVKEKGYTLEIVEFEDYVKPNQALTDGDIDANFFQHQPYLTDYNKKNKTDIVGVKKIHFETLGIYKGSKSSLNDLSKGDKIGVPNDTTNEARALLLLEANGIIKLKQGVGLEATKKDIVSNPKGIEIVELEAAVIPKSLPDLALGVINGNYALSSGLKVTDSIANESSTSEAADEYANIIAVRKEDKDSEKTKILEEVLTSDACKKFIQKNYGNAVLPVF